MYVALETGSKEKVCLNTSEKKPKLCVSKKPIVWKTTKPNGSCNGGGKIFWSHGTGASRGVCILISKNSNIQVISSFSDSNGRIVGIVMECDQERFILVNLYAPNEDSPEFFLEVLRLMEQNQGRRIILGDYNLVLDEKLDRTLESRETHVKAAKMIRNYMEETMLCDIWRVRNEDKKVYTYTRKGAKNKLIGSRLDMFLIDVSISSWVTDCKIYPKYKSDHSPCLLTLETLSNERGRGYWKMNNKILYEKEYVETMNEELEKTKQSFDFVTDPQEKWEAIKLKSIAISQSYSIERARNRNMIINQLEETISKYEEKGIDNLTKGEEGILNRTNQDLESFRDEKVQEIIFRSKVKWHSDGQIASKYLCSLEKAKSEAKNMNKLLTDSGQIITNSTQILHKQLKFYEKLYTAEEVEPFPFKNEEKRYILPELRSKLEGKFTKEEIREAVKGMARNKSPGLDGLTTEFYVVFLTKFEDVLLDALNYAFTNTGKLHKSAMRGVITLIPKKGKDIRKVASYRPISLLCTDYKIVEKILANRLKPALDFIINQDQKGFMADRRISCNIRCILDMIDYAEKHDLPAIVVSIDFLKCFDRIETTAILDALAYFNVGPDFCKWTKIIYSNSNPTACIINNGEFLTIYANYEGSQARWTMFGVFLFSYR